MDSQRYQRSTLFDAEKSSPQYANNSTALSENVLLSRPSSPQAMVQLIPCSQDALHNNDPYKDHRISPGTSACINEFLVDPMEGECSNRYESPGPQSKLAGELPQYRCTSTKETQAKCIKEGQVKAQQCSFLPSVDEVHPAAVPMSAMRDKQNSLDHIAAENSSLKLKDQDSGTLKRGDDKSLNSPGANFQETQDGELHVLETGEHGEWDYGHRLSPVSSQSVQTDHTYHYNSQAISKISGENQLLCYCKEGAQHQCGMCKCLQFETARNRRTSTDHSSWTIESAVSNAQSTLTPLVSENVSHSESVATSSNMQVTELLSLPWTAFYELSSSPCGTPETYGVDRFFRSIGGSITEAQCPSGIGMHSNSIRSAASANDNIKVEIPAEDFATQEENLLSGTTYQASEDPRSCLTSRNLKEHNSVESATRSDPPLPSLSLENTEENLEESQAISLNTSFCYNSLLDTELLESFTGFQHTDHYLAPYNMKRSPLADADEFGRSTCTSPRKKRKKGSENEDGRRCNCKRSSCLKLYCECFAAGEYCAEVCACQGCLNTVGYEDTVSRTREQIESRNPHAFAPKIILPATELLEDAGGSMHLRPGSARHKRGCNCKKSLCLKKYCECYQAHVGCSLGCRCVGCQNTFGRKDACGEAPTMENESRCESDKFGGKPGVMEFQSELGTPIQCLSHASPLTPTFQSSKELYVGQTAFPTMYYPSSDPGVSLVSSYYVKSPSSPWNSVNNDICANETEAYLDLAVYDGVEVPECNDAVQVSSFSTRFDESAALHGHSPFTNPPSSVRSAPAASERRDSKSLEPKFFGGSWQASSGFQWHESPLTPQQQFGESKSVLEPDSDDNWWHHRYEDDGTKIMKEMCLPTGALQTSPASANQVSPLQEDSHITSSSSPGERQRCCSPFLRYLLPGGEHGTSDAR